MGSPKTPTKPPPKRKAAAPKDWRETFIVELARSGVVSHSCVKAKVNRKTAYDRRDTDPAFAEAWDEALTLAIEKIEASVFRRATDADDGASHILAMFLLKAHKPERYREPRGDVNITVAPAVASSAEATAALEAAQLVRDGGVDRGPKE